MSRSMIQSMIRPAGFLTLAVGLAGCSANYTTGNSADVLLLIAAVNTGNHLQSDVLTSGSVVSDTVPVAIAVRWKNHNTLTTPNFVAAVILERYEVRYRRSDGRGVEGQDVPYTISGNLTTAMDVKNSGTDDVNIEVVRAQAKLDPPLRNLQSVTGTSLGGPGILTVFADITIHGRTISGDPVTATGTLQIDFADYN